MSVLTCAEVREFAPELALGILGGAERAEVVFHVNGCARCQAYVAELTEAADAIPQLVPEAEPPPGFEARVLRQPALEIIGIVKVGDVPKRIDR